MSGLGSGCLCPAHLISGLFKSLQSAGRSAGGWESTGRQLRSLRFAPFPVSASCRLPRTHARGRAGFPQKDKWQTLGGLESEPAATTSAALSATVRHEASWHPKAQRQVPVPDGAGCHIPLQRCTRKQAWEWESFLRTINRGANFSTQHILEMTHES